MDTDGGHNVMWNQTLDNGIYIDWKRYVDDEYSIDSIVLCFWKLSEAKCTSAAIGAANEPLHIVKLCYVLVLSRHQPDNLPATKTNKLHCSMTDTYFQCSQPPAPPTTLVHLVITLQINTG